MHFYLYEVEECIPWERVNTFPLQMLNSNENFGCNNRNDASTVITTIILKTKTQLTITTRERRYNKSDSRSCSPFTGFENLSSLQNFLEKILQKSINFYQDWVAIDGLS